MRNLLFISVFATIALISCSSEGGNNNKTDESPRIKRLAKITSPKNNARYHLGDSIPFTIESDQKIDSISMEYGDEKYSFTRQSFQWAVTNTGTGRQKVRLSVYMQDKKETIFARVTLLAPSAPERLTYEILDTYDHDMDAYTQGLFFKGDTLIESTGRNGHSWLRKQNLQGQVYKSIPLPKKYFGEGSTYWNGQYFQLTWTSNVGFIYNDNLEQVSEFHYPHQGWGITTMDDLLVISDGSEKLHLVDPRDFSEQRVLQVYDHQQKQMQLNELEYFDGLIYANVYTKDFIVAIDPGTGAIIKKIEMGSLRESFDSEDAEELNGIAYHAPSSSVYVTGKLWPKLFRVAFKPI